jgi:hypothetical protein
MLASGHECRGINGCTSGTVGKSASLVYLDRIGKVRRLGARRRSFGDGLDARPTAEAPFLTDAFHIEMSAP